MACSTSAATRAAMGGRKNLRAGRPNLQIHGLQLLAVDPIYR
jgi:hypothetical protein